MNRVLALWHTSVGKKAVMAVTGIIMVAYLITHVLANLLVFQGPDQINRYSRLLHGTGGALWAARLVLLVALVLHIVAAVQLTARRRAARPVGYAGGREAQVSTFASRTIRWGGGLILVFLVYHILHFTLGTVHPSFVEGDPYHNVATGFARSGGGGVLRARHGGRRPAPLSRDLEQRAEPGRERAVAAARSGASWRWCWRSVVVGWVRGDSGRGARG